MKVLIIDNYDSFTYNLYQFIGEIFAEKSGDHCVTVKRNDEIDLSYVAEYQPDRIIISPGPGSPVDPEYFGVCRDVILECGKTTPVLGVCLGMQGIVHCFGGRIVKAKVPMHGKTSIISNNQQGVFSGMPEQIDIMRYHSLVAEQSSLPEALLIDAVVANDQAYYENDSFKGNDLEIMGVHHREYPVYGIQFHPESFASEGGKEVIQNFLEMNHNQGTRTFSGQKARLSIKNGSD